MEDYGTVCDAGGWGGGGGVGAFEEKRVYHEEEGREQTLKDKVKTVEQCTVEAVDLQVGVS